MGGLVFTSDDNGLISASWNKPVVYSDVSLLKSFHEDKTGGHKEDNSTPNLAGDMRRIFCGAQSASVILSFFAPSLSHLD